VHVLVRCIIVFSSTYAVAFCLLNQIVYLLHWDLAIACSYGFVQEVYWVTLCLFWQNTGWKFGQGWHSFHETFKFDTAELWIPKIHLNLYFSMVLLSALSYAQPLSHVGWRFLFLRSTSSFQSPYSVRLHFSDTSLCICTLKWHGTVFCGHSCMQFAFFFALLSCTCVCVYALTNNIKHDWLWFYLF